MLKLAIVIRCVILVCVSSAAVLVLGQAKEERMGRSPLCTRDNALEMIKQQIAVTRSFDDSLRRVRVLIRAADLLWPHEQKRARGFAEAFKLATQKQKKKDERTANETNTHQSVILRLAVSDDRYVVLSAVAKRDLAWARNLTHEMLKKETNGSAASPDRDLIDQRIAAVRLLHTATYLPDLVPSLIEAREKILVSLSVETQNHRDRR